MYTLQSFIFLISTWTLPRQTKVSRLTCYCQLFVTKLPFAHLKAVSGELPVVAQLIGMLISLWKAEMNPRLAFELSCQETEAATPICAAGSVHWSWLPAQRHPRSRLLHSPSLVGLELSVRHETWYPSVIGWSKYMLHLPRVPLHFGLTWPVGISAVS